MEFQLSVKDVILQSLLFVLFLFQGFIVSAHLVEISNGEVQDNCRISKVLTDLTGTYQFDESRYFTDFCIQIKPAYVTSIIVSFREFSFGKTDGTNQRANFVEILNNEGGFLNVTQRRYSGLLEPFSVESYSGSVTIWLHQLPAYFGSGKLLMQYTAIQGCHEDVVVETYKYISYSHNINLCTWSVSLKNMADRDKTLELQISALGAASVSVYDGINGRYITSFDRNNGSSRIGSRVSSSSGTMFIKYAAYAGYKAAFNATVKLKGVCTPGTKPCGDGENCYTNDELCDGKIQCTTGFDELGCGNCPENEFWCGGQDIVSRPRCYKSAQRCNGYEDCTHTKQDEAECHTCGHGAILCKSNKRCIYERWLCDQDTDCPDGSDEEGCLYPASRRVITAAIVGALVCSLLLVISLGCTCKLYSLRTAHSRRSVLHSTPLTRVEREIFARQAPPTYDMTVSGIDPDAVGTRQQRNRRRRSRRYPFQRSAPARTETQAGDNREEGTQESRPSQETVSSNTGNATNSQSNETPTLANNENNAQHRQQRSSTLQSLGSFFFDSMRSAPLASSTSANAQTSSSRNRGSQNQASSRSGGRRSTSSGRSRSSRSSNSDQQAKALPKKKRILPVRVPAPCEDGAVEEDLLACIYPTPPSYSQAILLDEAKVEKEHDESEGTISETTISQNILNEDNVTIDETLTTRTNSRLSFSFSQALQKLAASSFRKFWRNPYRQMAILDSRRNSEQETHDTIPAAENDASFILPIQTRGSTSSDEDLLDCSLNNSARDDEDGMLLSHSTPTAQDGPVSSSKKMFPQRRLGNFTPARVKDEDCNSIHMFDLSSGERN